ncbi:Hypothetical protein, putative [Bodo saltans]|nr:Hypothetical protein, putative [Bodo saltans]|eukprot:CUG89416.1 Hypothetical protein, putative [Bodo saltans]
MARIFAPASSTAGAKSTTVIFTAGKSAAPNKPLQTAVAAAPNSGNAASSQRLHGLLVALWSRHGADVAQYAACTAAGMESLLLPLMRRATSTSAGQQQLDVAFVIEALEAKFSPNATTWTTLEAVAASSPQLQASEALAFVKSQSALLVNSTTVAATDSDISSRLTALRAASLLLGSAVALAHNTDDDDDDDDVTPAHHAATFATAVLDAVPLSCLGTLVISAAATSASSLTAARGAVVAFATTLTKCVVEHNCEADLFTALRHSATKELLALMTTVLGHGDSEDALSTTSDAVATVEVTKGAAGMVNFVGKLLTAIAPLLNESESTTGSSSSSSTSLLHVVILALMLRLEPLSGTEVLQFRTVVECCRDIITTFDVDTQMMCIAGVMRTLMYPHNPLKRSIESEVAGGDNESHGDDNEDEASAAHGGIVKKLLKANKIINRQELILELVVSTLKSDEFLAPFIAQQQRGGGSNRHQLKKKKTSQEEEVAAAAAAAGEEDEGKEAEAHSSHDTCMQLLLTSLGLFAHYHTLNESTENVIDNTPTSDEEEGAVISEEKSFVMMLELLSGNALGCILAGINEPTFVECLKRLLNDSRVALQVKGLEMLVDRLHQAVPTIEDTLTDSEAEQRRRDLRDPRKKLTNYDLLLLKARPLATKRTMALFPLMHHLLSGSLRTVVKSSATAAPHRQLVLLAQLGITAMEELARTVGSGGSLHSEAEATLAQSERSLVVSEAQVFKLFGSKAKAAEVKTFLSLLLTQLGPLQQRITALSSADASSVAATKKSTSATAIELAALFASAVTAVATIVQTLGAAFVASFSNEIMQVSSSALSFCVSTMPGELARAPIGSLVRVACFNTVLRVFSATWLMCAPYLPQILAASCHKTSVSDSETSASSAELLRTIKALIEPRVMLECCCTALSGSSSSAPTIKATTHNFTVLFECIESLVQSLTKRDIAAMPVLVADIPEVSRNMWIAALQSLASMPQLPTADEANAVSDAFLAMIVKFKSDDCKRHITTLLSWAFEELTGGAAATAAKKSEKKGSKKADDDDIDVSLAPTVSNSKQGLHRMILFLGLHNRVVDKLQSLSEFSFAAVSGALVPTFVQSIRRSSDAQDDDDEDDVRGRKRSAGLDALSTLLLESALDAVRRMSDAQVPAPDTPVAAITTPYFAEAKVFNALMPPFFFLG